MNNKNSLIINAFGGPGSGKTTACFYVACELKKKGYVVEFVPEYSKELVWEENWDLLDGSFVHQEIILNEQKKRIDRLVGKVDFIITDAPLLFNYIYLKENDKKEKYMPELLHIFNTYNNFNFFVKRDNSKFEDIGRLQNFNESKYKDKEILSLLNNNHIYYGRYSHETLGIIVSNAIKTYNERIK